jgi:hypothetical protein
MPGCQFAVTCVGEGAGCEDLDEDTCGLYPECGFRSECTGRADDCGDVSTVEQCRLVPGCFPADTDPSIVP